MITLSKDQINAEAKRLYESEMQRKQVSATTGQYPDMTISDAYHIQDAGIAIKASNGRRIIGHKVGLTSKVMQRVMSIDEPDFGVLLDDMHFENGASIKASDHLDPRIEVELGFALNKDINPDNVTRQDILDATEYIVPALELIAARSYRVNPSTGYKRTVRDTISDNAANAGVIMGEVKIPMDTDLRWIPCLLYKNGVIEQSGVSGAVLDDPIRSLIWLAKKYAEYDRVLKAGQIVLAGSFTAPVSVAPGDQIVADFHQYGKVTCQFH